MQLKNLANLEVANKKVLLRTDLNVSLEKKTGRILGDFKIRQVLPTIDYLLKNKATVIICSHLGKPDGKFKKEYSLKPVAKQLEKLLKKKILFSPDCLGEKAKKTVQRAQKEEINVVVLENLRFYKGEEENSDSFAKKLAELADVYVNDAFAVSHRKHASVNRIGNYLKGAAGLLMEKEYNELSKVLAAPFHPLVVIIGGAKISDKIETIYKLAQKADSILLGGALANTFLLAQGIAVGSSLVEVEEIKTAKELMKKFVDKLKLPSDGILSVSKDGAFSDANIRQTCFDDIEKNELILDVGPITLKEYCPIIRAAEMVFWAGPLGYYEDEKFAQGTKDLADCITGSKAYSVIGGGDTVTALENFGKIKKINFVSTGGGATLEFLAGKEMPGLEPLLLVNS